jgi:abhydrolase domain-containing protein 13
MRQLYELSTAPRKIWKPLPGGDHNSSVLEEGYFEAIADFIADVTADGASTEKEKERTKA